MEETHAEKHDERNTGKTHWMIIMMKIHVRRNTVEDTRWKKHEIINTIGIQNMEDTLVKKHVRKNMREETWENTLMRRHISEETHRGET